MRTDIALSDHQSRSGSDKYLTTVDGKGRASILVDPVMTSN